MVLIDDDIMIFLVRRVSRATFFVYTIHLRSA